MEKLETAIGYHFRNREFLHRALTHSSFVNERALLRPEALRDNEQLEFLGDSVLGFLISEALVLRFPELAEGRLSKLRARVVSAVHLFDVAQKLRLGEFLLLGRGEEMSGGRLKKTLLADALEALIAAVYLDGGMEAARALTDRFVLGEMDWEGGSENGDGASARDYKSALQELAQARKLPPPSYAIVREQGPEHSKTFTIEVRVGADLIGQAQGGSKKSAAQNAARDVLAKLIERQ